MCLRQCYIYAVQAIVQDTEDEGCQDLAGTSKVFVYILDLRRHWAGQRIWVVWYHIQTMSWKSRSFKAYTKLSDRNSSSQAREASLFWGSRMYRDSWGRLTRCDCTKPQQSRSTVWYPVHRNLMLLVLRVDLTRGTHDLQHPRLSWLVYLVNLVRVSSG